MSAAPVASYLVDFSSAGDGDSNPGFALRATAANANTPILADKSAAEINEAYARGLECGKAAGAAELEARLEERRAQYEKQLALERHAWVSGEGRRLAAQLTSSLSELEQKLANTAARILEPFLAAEIRGQTVDELRAALEVLLRKDPQIKLNISGSKDLLDAPREHLGSIADLVTYTPGEGPDVRVEAGETVLETRLEAWLSAIRGAQP
jgi:flagellar biosynthesis/type III secretory pathway protein FliH